MTVLRTLDDLDRLLTDAAGMVSEAAADSSAVGGEHESQFKRALADALVRIWAARDAIHCVRPDLKPELARQTDVDPNAAHAYFKARAASSSKLASGDIAGARQVLLEFESVCSSEYFKGLAAAERQQLGGAI